MPVSPIADQIREAIEQIRKLPRWTTTVHHPFPIPHVETNEHVSLPAVVTILESLAAALGSDPTSVPEATTETAYSGSAYRFDVNLLTIALNALAARWDDPEFWKDEGAEMDSRDCAHELREMLAGCVVDAPAPKGSRETP